MCIFLFVYFDIRIGSIDQCLRDVLTGISLIYFLCLLFAIYQKYDDVKEVMYWLYPELRHWEPDEKVG